MLGLIPSASLDSTFSSFLFPSGAGPPTRPHLYAECRAETQPAAMGTAVRAWRLNTASRLQPGDRKNNVSSCLLNPELRQAARNRESSERAALFMVIVGKYTA